jgi:CRP-like cAMP-binding protein
MVDFISVPGILNLIDRPAGPVWLEQCSRNVPSRIPPDSSHAIDWHQYISTGPSAISWKSLPNRKSGLTATVQLARESLAHRDSSSSSPSRRGPDTIPGMSDKIWYLKRCQLFEQLPPGELGRLEGRARVREFPRGCPVYLPADEADGVLVLAKGRVKIASFSSDGKQAILAFIEPGELFGELALFDAGQRQEYAEAVEPSTVILLPAAELQRLIEDNPRVSLGITRLIGLRRRRIERRLKYLLFRSNRERLVNLLLELAEQYGKPHPQGLLVDIKLSHQDLASIIGSTRETVTVLLGELQAEGQLKLGRRQIILTRPEDLAASVEAVAPIARM